MPRTRDQITDETFANITAAIKKIHHSQIDTAYMGFFTQARFTRPLCILEKNIKQIISAGDDSNNRSDSSDSSDISYRSDSSYDSESDEYIRFKKFIRIMHELNKFSETPVHPIQNIQLEIGKLLISELTQQMEAQFDLGLAEDVAKTTAIARLDMLAFLPTNEDALYAKKWNVEKGSDAFPSWNRLLKDAMEIYAPDDSKEIDDYRSRKIVGVFAVCRSSAESEIFTSANIVKLFTDCLLKNPILVKSGLLSANELIEHCMMPIFKEMDWEMGLSIKIFRNNVENIKHTDFDNVLEFKYDRDGVLEYTQPPVLEITENESEIALHKSR